MTINPLTQSSTDIQTDAIQINALDPANLADFYEHKIGLTLIENKADQSYYALGTPNKKVLLEIFKTDQAKVAHTTGLYHMAFLLPSRQDLGNVLLHFVKDQVPLEGASDHGYSEALYLPDPEGNGIEIYADKDKSEWDIREDGLIGGIVVQMDAEGVLATADPSKEYQGFPDGTTMGHIHLHVNEVESTMAFYHEVLGLGVKFLMGNAALFMASGEYHHHLGANIWNGENIPAADLAAQGLRASVWSANKEAIDTIKSRLEERDHAFDESNDELGFLDPAGTQVIIRQTV